MDEPVDEEWDEGPARAGCACSEMGKRRGSAARDAQRHTGSGHWQTRQQHRQCLNHHRRPPGMEHAQRITGHTISGVCRTPQGTTGSVLHRAFPNAAASASAARASGACARQARALAAQPPAQAAPVEAGAGVELAARRDVLVAHHLGDRIAPRQRAQQRGQPRVLRRLRRRRLRGLRARCRSNSGCSPRGRARPDAPACQARSSQDTNCSTAPSRRTRKCADTRRPRMPSKYGCASQSRRLVNSRSIASPPYSPGGRLIECTTARRDGHARRAGRRSSATGRRGPGATSRAASARGAAHESAQRCRRRSRPGAPCGSASGAATGPGWRRRRCGCSGGVPARASRMSRSTSSR